MSLEQHIADLVSATNGLTQEVRDQLGDIQASVAQAEIDVQTFIQQGAANQPLSPNLLPDSKKFTGLCQGQLNTIMAWDEGGLAHPWNGFWLNGASGALDVEVVDVGDEARLTQLGLWPLGPLNDLVEPFPHDTLSNYGQDSHIALFNLRVDAWSNAGATTSGVPFILQTDCLPYTGWAVGRFKTQASAYMAVISANHLSLELFRNRVGNLPAVGAPEAGQGWRHYAAAREGFGGCNSSYVLSDVAVITPTSNAHLHVALALPYQGFGDHQGLPIWCGYSGRWDIGDVPQVS